MFSSETRKWAAVTLLGALALPGCGPSLDEVKMPDLPAATRKADAPGRVAETEKWREAGSGVYIFKFDDNWKGTLQEFCNTNPNLSVIDISRATEGSYSRTRNVLVLTAPKVAETGK